MSVFEELKKAKGGVYNYYEDVDAWVISPYRELDEWARKQYRELKADSKARVVPFRDRVHNINSRGSIERKVKWSEIAIPNKKGKDVNVKNITAELKLMLESEGGESLPITLRFFGSDDYPLY